MKPETKQNIKSYFKWIGITLLFLILSSVAIIYPDLMIPVTLFFIFGGIWLTWGFINNIKKKQFNIPQDTLNDLKKAEEMLLERERRYEENGEPINHHTIVWEIAKSKSWRDASPSSAFAGKPRVESPNISGEFITGQELPNSIAAEPPTDNIESSGDERQAVAIGTDNPKGFLRRRPKRREEPQKEIKPKINVPDLDLEKLRQRMKDGRKKLDS